MIDTRTCGQVRAINVANRPDITHCPAVFRNAQHFHPQKPVWMVGCSASGFGLDIFTTLRDEGCND